MITDKDIQKSREVITQLIREGLIIGADKDFVNFFLAKSDVSLQTAKVLSEISNSTRLKDELHLKTTYDGYTWVINSAYYSMFYAATALLAKHSCRINVEQGKHSLTYHALVYYFLDLDKKMTKHIIEQYQEAELEASQILQIAEQKAREHIEKVKFELSKRREFTYEMGKIAEKDKADTSIKRAQEFLTLVREMILNNR